MNLILCGFKKSGKTTLGKLLSKALKCDFFDVDVELEKIYLETYHSPLSCREIFQLKGEDFFRSLEVKAIMKLASVKGSIISLGGGSLSNDAISSFIQSLGTVVYLRVDKEDLIHRILKDPVLPSFISSKSPMSSLAHVLDLRAPIYEKYADYILETKGLELDQIVHSLANYWEQHVKQSLWVHF